MYKPNFTIKAYFSKATVFDVNIYHDSAQVIRFNLKFNGYEMNLEKRKLVKTQPWKVLSASFQFTKDDAARNLGELCKLLDEHIKKQSDYIDVHPKNSWDPNQEYPL